ncbi:hypothetical protein DDY07_22225 [Methylomonas sp. ZR1]|nr:hypothetical protein [Methylomonas sp. ZR1]
MPTRAANCRDRSCGH